MLCHSCETFLTHILHQDFSSWRRVEQGWFTFSRLGNYAAVSAAAEAGCEMCALFNRVRCEKIPNYANLSDKWHSQPASIDVKYDKGCSHPAVETTDGHTTSRWSFLLLTVAPEMSWIPFELYRPDDLRYRPISNNELDRECARAISTNPTSRQTLEIAHQWITQCLASHPACSHPESPPLPTRVIDVGTSGDNPTPRLQVNRGHRGRYVTLSHCWGVGSRLTLTKRNLREFTEGIPFATLPKTFQDAIRLTISLGMRYLWIDALGILQDDTDDWKKESRSMCSVFENASFSISALSASDSRSGILADRDIPHIVTKIDGEPTGVRTRLHSLPEALQASRLETRAWCFQERLLARAILHVAPHQLYWECRTRTLMESQPEGEESESSMYLESPKVVPGKSGASSWLRLVTEYSAREITKPSDRLPAIAGLAQRENRDNRTYIQGIWSEDEHASLMWRRRTLIYSKIIPSRDSYSSRVSSRDTARPKETIASSWSWASINDAIEFPILNTFPVRLETKLDAVFETDNTPTSRGQKHPGMKVRGILKRGSCKPSTEASSGLQWAIFRASGSLLVDDGVVCWLDYDDDPVSRGCYCLRIANWSSTESKATRKRQESVSIACYLVLEKIGEDGGDQSGGDYAKFKRIGMGYDLVAKVDRLFVNAVRRAIQLF